MTDSTVEPSSKEFARQAAALLRENKGEDVLLLDVKESLNVTDYFVIATGDSPPHLKFLHREIKNSLDPGEQRELVGREGAPEEEWLLTDYGDVIIHLFSREKREYYDLESLWADADVVTA